jgi:predicted transport protein
LDLKTTHLEEIFDKYIFFNIYHCFLGLTFKSKNYFLYHKIVCIMSQKISKTYAKNIRELCEWGTWRIERVTAHRLATISYWIYYITRIIANNHNLYLGRDDSKNLKEKTVSSKVNQFRRQIFSHQIWVWMEFWNEFGGRLSWGWGHS